MAMSPPPPRVWILSADWPLIFEEQAMLAAGWNMQQDEIPNDYRYRTQVRINRFDWDIQESTTDPVQPTPESFPAFPLTRPDLASPLIIPSGTFELGQLSATTDSLRFNLHPQQGAIAVYSKVKSNDAPSSSVCSDAVFA